ncbi:MAG: methionine ABC transporter ATP-binding protein [Cellulosilyticaceae bacterium]
MIEIKNINKVFAEGSVKVHALKDVTLQIEQGDIFGMIGYSGAGKSTLLRCINGLEKPTDGTVTVLGKSINSLKEKQLRELRKEIGMIFQHFNLMSSRTIYDNIAYPLKGKLMSKSQKDERIQKLLKLVGLEEKAKAYPAELSGGQKQRVAIARALATEPQILLCDEATSALDPMTTGSILALLKQINQELGITIVLITHQMEVIKEICTKVAVMENGQVVETGSLVEVFTHPQSRIAKEFVTRALHYEKVRGQYTEKASKLLHLKYIGTPASEPIISAISQKFDVTANITFGSIEKLQDISFGNLIIDLQGSEAAVEQAIDYMNKQQVEVEVIDDERITYKNHA